MILRWSRDRVSCSPTAPNYHIEKVAQCRAQPYGEASVSNLPSCRGPLASRTATPKCPPTAVLSATPTLSAHLREKEAIWEHSQYEGGAGTRGPGSGSYLTRTPLRGAPQSDASPLTHQSPSRWVACSSSGSQVARPLPGHHFSVAASPLRCRTGLSWSAVPRPGVLR